MAGWRQILLRDFEEPIPSLSLVSDPDGFLYDSKITKELEEKGIEIIEYTDPVPFRYVYEFKFRQDLVDNSIRLIVRVKGSLGSLPYDLLQSGRRLEYQFSSIFPRLSPFVVRQLEPREIDILYDQYPDYTGSTSVADTCDFILQRVYRIAYHLIDTKTDLIKTVLSIHQTEKTLAPAVQEHLIVTLEKRPLLRNIPVRELVASEGAVYQYLAEEWPRFLSMQVGSGSEVGETRGQFSPVESHPFEDVEVRGLLSSAFLEAKIPKVDGFDLSRLPAWTKVGLKSDEHGVTEEQFASLLEKIEGYLIADQDYRQAKQLASLMGEAKSLWLSSGSTFGTNSSEAWDLLTQSVDFYFQGWLKKHFNSLLSLPYSPKPVMVHHIPHYLGSVHTEKTALIVLDGMNFAQWVQIRAHLQSVGTFRMEEDAVFAWVPTITSVSRQAIFSGDPPFAFSNSIQTTNKDEQAWKLFWENRGIFRNYIAYRRGLGDGTYDASQSPDSSSLVVGYVVDTIDRLVHKEMQGHRGIHDALKLWLEGNYLNSLIQDLLTKGFSVYLTSDHGNCESVGIGRLNEGVLAQTKGERVRVYNSQTMRDRFLANYQGIAWDGHGLPPDMFLLLAKSGDAFTNYGDLVVSHGGISLEEVVVPFIHIKQDR